MAKSFFEIASEAEGIDFHLEDVRNLVELFDEHLLREVENLKEGPSLVDAFICRVPMLTALLGAIESGLTDVAREIQLLSEQAMESHKNSKRGESG